MALKEDKENAINGKQKDSICDETDVVSGAMERNGKKPTPKSAPSSVPTNTEVDVRREKRASEAGVPL